MVKPYEYGMLQQLGRQFHFFSNANKGGRLLDPPVYRAMNDLGRDGWEPLFFYHEETEDGTLTPTWVMRLEEG
jgi:hypothetical protein